MIINSAGYWSTNNSSILEPERFAVTGTERVIER